MTPTDIGTVLMEIAAQVRKLSLDAQLDLHTRMYNEFKEVREKDDYKALMKPGAVKDVLEKQEEHLDAETLNVNIPQLARVYETYARILEDFGIKIPTINELIEEYHKKIGNGNNGKKIVPGYL